MNHSNITLLLLVIASTFAVEVAEGDKKLDERIDRYIAAEMKSRRVPGLSLAVAKSGNVVKARGYGFANVELSAPATAETVYQLASVTKPITATAVMQLVEKKKIGLEDRIVSHLANLPDAWSNVTVRHLLTHTSGIKNYTQLPAFGENPVRDYTQAEMIALVADLPLQFRPGEQYDYSNTGYFLLGMLIEKASRLKYGDYLEKNIFGPLGMNDTRFTSFSRIIPRRAAGYVLQGEGIANGVFVNPSQPFSAGALVTSVLDLAKLDAGLRGEKILKQASLREMWTPMRMGNGTLSNYGLGWATWMRNGRRYTQHNGGIIGFSSHMRRDLDSGLTVIVLANLSGRGIIAEEIAEGITALYEAEPEKAVDGRTR